jgi:hypothetical protein
VAQVMQPYWLLALAVESSGIAGSVDGTESIAA